MNNKTHDISLAVSRRDFQKDKEAAVPPKSSPPRFAVVSPKPQSPGERCRSHDT